MTWQQFKDLDPNYSGYAWVQFWQTYGDPTNPEWIHLCKIWNTKKRSDYWWSGYDLDFDAPMNQNYRTKVLLVDKPE